jgi:folylpolyglutamate synthase/dihydropteroate synthase
MCSGLHEILSRYDGLVDWGRATAGRNATRFDLETLTAILAFVDARVTWAVVECGLGGRVDSTNVIDGEVCLLTNVGLEHTAVLGTTHAAIAFQKGRNSETRSNDDYGRSS